MENKLLKRILGALTVVLVAISVIIGAMSIAEGDIPSDKRKIEQLGIIAYNKEADKCQCNPTKTVEEFSTEELRKIQADVTAAATIWVGWAKVLLGITGGVWVIFLAIGVAKNPKGLGRRAIVIGAFAILLLIVYFGTAIPDGTFPEDMAMKLDANGVEYNTGGYNLASWGIAGSLILIVLAIAAWVFGWVYTLVKK